MKCLFSSLCIRGLKMWKKLEYRWKRKNKRENNYFQFQKIICQLNSICLYSFNKTPLNTGIQIRGNTRKILNWIHSLFPKFDRINIKIIDWLIASIWTFTFSYLKNIFHHFFSFDVHSNISKLFIKNISVDYVIRYILICF